MYHSCQRVWCQQDSYTTVFGNGSWLIRKANLIILKEQKSKTLYSLLSVKAGDSIPIDGIVVSGRSTIDEISLTGESLPVEKEIGGSLWAGTINLTGYLCIETSAFQRSNMDQLVETFAKFYTPTIVVTAFAIAIVPVILHAHHVRHWLYLALVLLVVACPCALVISTPVTTTCAIAQAARKGLLVKGGQYLEALGRIKIVAMDKTGTLTQGCFQVVQVETVNKNANLLKLLHWVSCIESESPPHYLDLL
ncbi:hypothetical protein L7F22_013049 [Adiantum nelumboides]|nr:hypothetical protein [Adiantum nelumboides]